MTDSGADLPWVQAFDGVWHARPADDEWTTGIVQARTMCGLAVASVAAVAVHPSLLPQPADDPEELCPACPDTQPEFDHTVKEGAR